MLTYDESQKGKGMTTTDQALALMHRAKIHVTTPKAPHSHTITTTRTARVRVTNQRMMKVLDRMTILLALTTTSGVRGFAPSVFRRAVSSVSRAMSDGDFDDFSSKVGRSVLPLLLERCVGERVYYGGPFLIGVYIYVFICAYIYIYIYIDVLGEWNVKTFSLARVIPVLYTYAFLK